VDLFNARTLDDVLARIGARAKEAKPGDVVITNADWHEAQLKDQRLPYRKDLDKIAPKVPVVVVRGGHEYILNSAALSKWHIDKATPEPAGGRISRDENGELNGELVDRAKALVTLPAEPRPALLILSKSTRSSMQRVSLRFATLARASSSTVLCKSWRKRVC
jgi:predicted amidohydrolase YtcJ